MTRLARKLLLESGASVEIGPCAGSFFWGNEFESLCAYGETLSPLAVAAIHGRMDIVRLLMIRGFPLDSQVLRFMALSGCDSVLENARALLQLDANPDGEPGRAPLLVAARAGNAPFRRMLIEAGAKPLP